MKKTDRTCFIHIGMHKTGTSSIQRTLYSNREFLANNFDIEYFSASINHSVLLSLFCNSPEKLAMNLNAGISTPSEGAAFCKSLQNKLLLELSNLRCKNFVLSGEGLTKLNLEAVTALKKLLLPFFSHFKIIVYARHPFSCVSSVSQQYLKGGEVFSAIVSDTFEQRGLSLLLNWNNSPLQVNGDVAPYYRVKIEKYIKVFGKENVMIREFNPKSFTKGDVVNDFFKHVLGFDEIPENIQVYHENTSMPHSQALILEAYNRKYSFYKNGMVNPERVRNIFQFFEKSNKYEKFVLPNFDYHAFADIVRPDVKWLSDITSGKIVFDVSEEAIPKQHNRITNSHYDDIYLETLNNIAIKENNERCKSWFLTMMLSYDRKEIYKPKSIYLCVKACTDYDFLKVMCNNLKVRGKLREALIAAKRACVLKSEANEMMEEIERLTSKVDSEFNFDSWFDN